MKTPTLLLALALAAGCSSSSDAGSTPPVTAPTQPSGSEATTPPPPMSSGGGGAQTATATIESRSGSQVTGTARFEERDGQVTVTVTVRGATPGPHGVHIHQNGDCSAADASSAGPHFNPTNANHGGPESGAHHAGDFGNVTVGADGTGTLTLTSRDLTVAAGNNSVVGRAIVVHASADDLTSQPAGNAGGRAGCGVIAAAP